MSGRNYKQPLNQADYANAEKKLAEIRKDMPTELLISHSLNSMRVANEELIVVVNRLGSRRQDLDDLLSIGNSLGELARKVTRLAERIAPQIVDERSK